LLSTADNGSELGKYPTILFLTPVTEYDNSALTVLRPKNQENIGRAKGMGKQRERETERHIFHF